MIELDKRAARGKVLWEMARGHLPELRLAIRSAALSLALLFCASGSASGFEVPERYEYQLSWAGLTVGVSSLEAKRAIGNRIQIVSTARSIGWASALYTVKDRVESILEPDPPLRPVFYHLNTREGSRRKNEEMWFDYKNSSVKYINKLDKSEEQYAISAGVFDPLSVLYGIREKELKVGESVYVTVFDNEKIYDLEVQVLGKERIEVPAGVFNTVLINPLLQSEGIFSRKGPVYTWLTDDHRKLPVMIKTKVVIGSITAALTSVEPQEATIRTEVAGAAGPEEDSGETRAPESAEGEARLEE